MASVSPRGVRLCAGAALALAWLFGTAASSPAQTQLSAAAIAHLRSTKPPEEWTTEERLAVRFDRGDILRRAETDRRQGRSGDPEIAAADQPALDPDEEPNSITGKENPELFLPIEIFDHLVVSGFTVEPQFRESFRNSLEASLRENGLDPKTFWPAFEAIAKRTIETNRERNELYRQADDHATFREKEEINKRLKELWFAECGPRVAELAEARERFGQRAFDLFLYHGVATGMTRISSRDPEWEDQARLMEGGCHETGH